MIRHRSYFLILIMLFLISFLQMATHTFANPLSESLIKASELGDLAKVKEILGRGADVNYTDKSGWTALIKAAFNGHTDIARELLAKGADVNITEKAGWSALMQAENHPNAVGKEGQSQ